MKHLNRIGENDVGGQVEIQWSCSVIMNGMTTSPPPAHLFHLLLERYLLFHPNLWSTLERHSLPLSFSSCEWLSAGVTESGGRHQLHLVTVTKTSWNTPLSHLLHPAKRDHVQDVLLFDALPATNLVVCFSSSQSCLPWLWPRLILLTCRVCYLFTTLAALPGKPPSVKQPRNPPWIHFSPPPSSPSFALKGT